MSQPQKLPSSDLSKYSFTYHVENILKDMLCSENRFEDPFKNYLLMQPHIYYRDFKKIVNCFFADKGLLFEGFEVAKENGYAWIGIGDMSGISDYYKSIMLYFLKEYKVEISTSTISHHPYVFCFNINFLELDKLIRIYVSPRWAADELTLFGKKCCIISDYAGFSYKDYFSELIDNMDKLPEELQIYLACLIPEFRNSLD